jgi:hypothetical protein
MCHSAKILHYGEPLRKAERREKDSHECEVAATSTCHALQLGERRAVSFAELRRTYDSIRMRGKR